MRVLILAACITVSAIVGAAAQAIERSLNVEVGGYHFEIDAKTGSLTRISDRRTGLVLHDSPKADELLLTVEGLKSAIGSDLSYRGHRVVDAGKHWELAIERADQEWQFIERYEIALASRKIQRSVEIAYSGLGHVTTSSLDMHFRLPVSNDSLIDLPAGFQPMGLAAGVLKRRSVPMHLGDPTRFVSIRASSEAPAVVVGLYSDSERPFPTTITADPHSPDHARVGYRLPLIVELKKGEGLAWRGDVLYTHEGARDAQFALAQRHFSEHGLVGPTNTPDWARAAHVYEVQIGDGRFDGGAYTYGRYSDDDALIADLPRIKSLGFEAIHLMPAFPFPGYSISDLGDGKVQYGADLLRLTRAVDRHDLKLVLDVLVHGVIDREITQRFIDQYNAREVSPAGGMDIVSYVYSNYHDQLHKMHARHPLRASHPSWFIRNRQGEEASTFTWAFQLQNPEVQDYIISTLEGYVDTYGVDGFRIDAPFWNAIPDWSETFPYRPSLYGDSGVSFMNTLMARMRSTRPNVFIYTEATQPEWSRGMDAAYSYDAFWITEELLEPFRTRGVPFHSPLDGEGWAPRNGGRAPLKAAQARDWFLERARARPVGVRTIHQTDSHDSFWWAPTGERFKHEVFGPQAFGAMFFMLATLGEPTLTYMGAEEGAESAVTRALRSAKHPVIRSGVLRLDAPAVSSEDVFAVLWTTDRAMAVPLTNFGQRATAIEIRLPDGMKVSSLRDADNGVRVKLLNQQTFSITLPPLGTALVTGDLSKAVSR